MSLATWLRRHRNVFSISTREVTAKGGDEDMLVEEYGKRAVEARSPTSYANRGGSAAALAEPLEVSEDEIAEDEQPPDSDS